MYRAFVFFLLTAFAWGQTVQPPAPTTTLDPAKLYQTYCAACHGVNMEGAQHTPLKKKDWLYGRDRGRMRQRVMYGIPNTDMIPWSQVLSNKQIDALVDYIIESQDTPPTEPRPFPDRIQTRDYLVDVEALVTEGFRSDPWGIEFVDEHRALITERRGGLRWLVNGELDPQPVNGIPVPTQYNDSGMLDIALDPQYEDNGWVYIGYVQALGDPSTKETPAMTRIIRGRVSGHQWIDQQEIFCVPDSLHFSNGTRWGCRLLFDKEGYLYFSIGDIGRNDEVQQLSKPGGKLYRIFPDGSIPPDNPFVGKPGALEAIFTLGNRNIQGIGQHPVTGALWATEHGPMGGDELNILEKGKNYGWPLISWGINYNGERVTDLVEKEGMEQPVKFWTPSPALCPLEFYTGGLFPKWKNQLFIGALAFEEVKFLRIGKERVISEEVILKNYGRVRDIKTGPEGALYVVL
ncbi:MAG: PQQ-dependent sugar dehydrogenase, partial [Verrucomicrobiae bacterium]|nr:PQQ-dependent sugar dehydrogenase [Verrucomicrobiae bacterium]